MSLPPHLDRPDRPKLSLLDDEEGAVYVEYISLIILVSIGAAAAIVAVGVPLLESFRMTQAFLGAPVP